MVIVNNLISIRVKWLLTLSFNKLCWGTSSLSSYDFKQWRCGGQWWSSWTRGYDNWESMP